MQLKTNRLLTTRLKDHAGKQYDFWSSYKWIQQTEGIFLFWFVFKMNLKFGKNKGISKNKGTLAHFSSYAKVFQLLPCLIC